MLRAVAARLSNKRAHVPPEGIRQIEAKALKKVFNQRALRSLFDLE
jgi:HEAT repeat protein